MSTHLALSRWLTTSVVVTAAALPSSAQAFQPLGGPATDLPGQTPSLVAPPTEPGGTGLQPGFQWDDAGIGAAGALLVLGTGAMASGTTRRRRRTHRAAIG